MWHQCNLAAKESGLECACVKNDFTVLVSGGSRRRWESMCTLWLLHSKWLSKYSNESASNFVLRLNIPPWKLFWWFRRPKLWATGDWQLHHNAPARASRLMQRFWENIKSPRWLSPSIAQIWRPATSGFPKTKITFEREEISDHPWDSGKYNKEANGDSTKGFLQCFEQWNRLQENCVRCQGTYFEGD